MIEGGELFVTRVFFFFFKFQATAATPWRTCWDQRTLDHSLPKTNATRESCLPFWGWTKAVTAAWTRRRALVTLHSSSSLLLLLPSSSATGWLRPTPTLQPPTTHSTTAWSLRVTLLAQGTRLLSLGIWALTGTSPVFPEKTVSLDTQLGNENAIKIIS